jgi:hypothetical protein
MALHIFHQLHLFEQKISHKSPQSRIFELKIGNSLAAPLELAPTEASFERSLVWRQ